MTTGNELELKCEWCGIKFTVPKPKRGAPPRYCKRSHRQRAYEARRQTVTVTETSGAVLPPRRRRRRDADPADIARSIDRQILIVSQARFEEVSAVEGLKALAEIETVLHEHKMRLVVRANEPAAELAGLFNAKPDVFAAEFNEWLFTETDNDSKSSQ